MRRFNDFHRWLFGNNWHDGKINFVKLEMECLIYWLKVGLVGVDEAGLSAECIELMSTSAEFEIKVSGNGAAPTNDDCELGDVAENASYDPLALTEDTCWSKSDADATYLKFMTAHTNCHL